LAIALNSRCRLTTLIRRASSTASERMKFFGTPAVRKTKTGPVIKRLLVRCPATAKLATTGQTIDEQLWAAAKVKTPKFTCPHCQQVHSWTKKDVVLAR
jgi:hypothetical protein